MPKKPTHREKTLPNWVTPVVIAVLCLLCYIPSLSTGFLSDDFTILNKIRHGSLTDIGSEGIFFRPLTIISFALDWYTFGDKPFLFHLVNLLMHIAASIGVAACAASLFRKPSAGLYAGIIFAIHPVHPEAVTWISGRFDVLCGALLVWSLFAYLKSRSPDTRKPVVYLTTSFILFGLACLAKEMAYAFPLVIIALELFAPKKPDESISGGKWLRVGGFILIAVLLFIIRYIRLGGMGGGGYLAGSEDNGIWQYIYRIFIQPYYILLLPLNRFVFQPALSPYAIIIQLVMLLPFLMLFQKQNWKLIGFCAVAIFLSYLPASFLGIEETKLMSSRFLYVPSIFYSMLIAGLFTSVNEPIRWKNAYRIIIGVFLIVMIMVLFQNNYPWSEAGRLVRNATASANMLIGKHPDEWWESQDEVLIVNVPRAYLGAYVFENGLPDMLHMRYGRLLDDVTISVMHPDAGTEATYGAMAEASQRGAIIWGFDSEKQVFIELDTQLIRKAH